MILHCVVANTAFAGRV